MIDFYILLKLINFLSDGSIFFPKMLGINSNKIYIYINIIKSWGINIHKLSNNTYKINYPLDLLDKRKILSNILKGKIYIFSVLDSTNQFLIKKINKLKSGDVCITEHQIKGRGKNGKKWISTFGGNICFSMYWFLKNGFNSLYGLSIIIAFVIAKVLYNIGLSEIFIKWPNDLYFKNKKIAGILIESIGKINNSVQVIIGIGININMPYTNKLNIKKIINLKDTGIIFDRNLLLINLINTLKKSLKKFESNKLLLSFPKYNLINNFIKKSHFFKKKNKDNFFLYKNIY